MFEHNIIANNSLFTPNLPWENGMNNLVDENQKCWTVNVWVKKKMYGNCQMHYVLHLFGGRQHSS